MRRQARRLLLLVLLLGVLLALTTAQRRRYQREAADADDDDDEEEAVVHEDGGGGRKEKVIRTSVSEQAREPAGAAVTKKTRGPIPSSVFDLGLMKGKKLAPQSILNHHASYSWRLIRSRRLQGVTLGFVTPWNNHGYVIAETFGAKFTHVAPVWYQVRQQEGDRQLVLTGGHDVDQGWIEKVRKNSTIFAAKTCGAGQCEEDEEEDDDHDGGTALSKAMIVPRVLWEIPRFPFMEEVPVIADMLAREIKKHGFDGLCFEFPIQREVTFKLLQELREQVPGAITVVAIPSYQMPDSPSNAEILLTPMDLRYIEPLVDLFPVMSYDFRGGVGGVPVSPLRWVQQLVNTLSSPDSPVWKKLLVGVPFYGYRGGEAVLGRDVVEVVGKHKVSISWDEASHEHFYDYTDGRGPHRMTYPSLLFLKERFDLAAKMGVAGVALWEVGQGLDYFMDLL